ncbi:MAG TPA: asparagine synthase (glutamine-hydrolyzing) [Cytophagales bacterium]|mgnify:CR=1 FL=1|nr:asparagine synthase (glutamine-hydrolyzing) [Cytophagales bacterium]
MCGITGAFAFNLVGKFNLINVTAATQALAQRGPDFQDIYTDGFVGLGHRRLSIIDTSDAGNQPMWDETKRYCIIFNGEIFNFKELRITLLSRGISFRSESDTEVLLKLFIIHKEKCLNKLNGFFSFCIYDKEEQTFFLARDRYGVKPLLYLVDEDKFLFASEMKALMCYGIEKTLDYSSLHTYLQLNYTPAPHTIFSKVKKLMPGHYIKVSSQKLDLQSYYEIPFSEESIDRRITYDQAKDQFKNLLQAAVHRRLVSDVPLGSFLSGGIDSSIVAGLASQYKPDLHTFSIGFKDEPFFDETHYARLVAKHFNTSHTVFSLTNNDLYSHVHGIMDYLDEPFADSSAIAVYILSKETRKHATVALSGDGADELLAGYNKHEAMYKMLHPGFIENLVGNLRPLWNILPHSRNNPLLNKFRQLSRFANVQKLDPKERYWQLAGFANETEARKLFSTASIEQFELQQYIERKNDILKTLTGKGSINEILLTDTQLVLSNDMLTKVDLMSMANSLEVRTPFLDYELVNFIFSLPSDFKINASMRKRIAQDAFQEMLPAKLYNRPKKGFEVPLLKWFRSEMKSLITDELLSKRFIEEQNIFNYDAISPLKKQLFSSNPGDVHARIWGLVVFQWWWKKNCK